MRKLIIGLLLAEVIGLTALILSVYDLSVRFNELQQSRITARSDTCKLLQTIIYIATPTQEKSKATQFLVKTHLDNCTKYAHAK